MRVHYTITLYFKGGAYWNINKSVDTNFEDENAAHIFTLNHAELVDIKHIRDHGFSFDTGNIRQYYPPHSITRFEIKVQSYNHQ